MKIKILGTGCTNCKRLEKNVELAIEKSRIKAEITKVTDIAKIMEYGVMSNPALVINEEVVSYGRVNEVKEIIELIKKK